METQRYCIGNPHNIAYTPQEIVKRHFEEWGPIEYVRVIHTKSIAFVRYFLRASAEFAKEAMDNQALDHSEVLVVRWATEDSNPTARQYEERKGHREATAALNKRLKMMGPAEHSTLYYDVTGEYPETEAQFDPAYLQYQYEYNSNAVHEPHPYSVMNSVREAYGPDYSTNPYASYGMYFGEEDGFAPAYITVERELAQQEAEEERIAGTDASGYTAAHYQATIQQQESAATNTDSSASDTTTYDTGVATGYETTTTTEADNNETTTNTTTQEPTYTPTINWNPYNNDQPLQFGKKT